MKGTGGRGGLSGNRYLATREVQVVGKGGNPRPGRFIVHPSPSSQEADAEGQGLVLVMWQVGIGTSTFSRNIVWPKGPRAISP